jgi:hypothetical protein
MKVNPFLTFASLIFSSIAYGQDSIYLKEKAIKIEKQDSLGDDIYRAISKYQVFMIGEMHGTNEPARFVMSLANLLVKKGSHVQVGMEIPSELMTKYISHPADSNIYSSDFFFNRRHDSRASLAWVNLISQLNDSHQVDIFFYDINIGSENFKDRDSLMYLKIKKRIQLHPSWKTITLSGNIHNMLMPYDGKIKMGLYLRNDKDLDISSKILSLNHFYASGAIWDNSNDNLQLYQVDNSNSFFAKTVDYENYLFIYPQEVKMKYSGVYFTRKVTSSNLVSEK